MGKVSREVHRRHNAKRWADPEYRRRKLEQNAAYKATTPGILSEERHYQKKMRGASDGQV